MIIDAKELKRRHVLRLNGVRDKKINIGPEVVDLQIINSCNLSCRHCWIHAPGNPAHFEKAVLFPWKRFLGIVRDCVVLNVDQVHIGGKGEPTLHPKFRDMMRHLEHKPLKVKLFTNATFPLKYCSDVIKADHVVIDLGAVDRNQYLLLHGKDLFDRVVKNIERLVSLRDAGKPDFFIEIVYIVNALNTGQKQKMKDLATRLGVNFVCFKKLGLHPFNRVIALPKNPKSKRQRTRSICWNGWFYVLVKLDGNTSICCKIQQMEIGDLDKLSFKQLWHSPRMMYTRLLGKNGYNQKMFKVCQTCTQSY